MCLLNSIPTKNDLACLDCGTEVMYSEDSFGPTGAVNFVADVNLFKYTSPCGFVWD